MEDLTALPKILFPFSNSENFNSETLMLVTV